LLPLAMNRFLDRQNERGFLPSQRDFGLVEDDEPSHKSRARVAGYFRMSRRDMAARPLSVIENQSCGDFSRGGENEIVRHYPHFSFMDDG
jgi:hypothetical protein